MGSKFPQYPPTQQFLPDGSPNPNYIAGCVKPHPSPPPPRPTRPFLRVTGTYDPQTGKVTITQEQR